MHCWSCGEWLEMEDEFCPECGTYVADDAGDSDDYHDYRESFVDEDY